MNKLEEMMNLKLEVAKNESKNGYVVWSLGNGKEVVNVSSKETKKILKDNGYWVVSIFEDGHMVCM